MDFDTATGLICEAALVPGRWPAVLDAVASIAGGVGTVMVADDMANLRWLNSPSLDRFMHDFVAGQWAMASTRTTKLLSIRRAGFLAEDDAYTREEIERDEMIRGFLRPRGFGWATATSFAMPGGGNLIFSIERLYDEGPVPRSAILSLDRIRRSLGQAALLSSKLGMLQAHATAETFAMRGLPNGIVGRAGALIEADESLQALIPHVLRDGRERLAFVDPAADAAFARALVAGIATAPVTIGVPARNGVPAFVAHLVPVRGAARDLFSGGVFVLALVPAVPSVAPPADLLRALFGLTRSEAMAVRAIVDGTTLGDYARRRGIGIETVRSQLKSVFAKTNVRRQSDLIRLVLGLGLTL